MKRLVYLQMLLLLLSCSVFAAESPRLKYNFNPGWKLYVGDLSGAEAESFNDADWKGITLPHAWNEDSAFKVSIDDLPTGIAWYRKHFKIPAGNTDKKVFLEFEGIRQAGEFYLNGKFIGRHENGVMAFGFDITDLLKSGDNVLAVRIDNAWNYKEKETKSGFQWNDKNFNANYGGISKNVWLHITDKLYQTLPLYAGLKSTGVYVYAKDFDIPGKSAKITAESEVKNDYAVAKTFQYEVELKDLDGKTIKTISGTSTTINPGETKTVSAATKVQDLNFWSWGYGYLYHVITKLKVNGKIADAVSLKTGFRKTEFKNGMVYLNDRVLMMHGYAQRTSNEWPGLGLSVPPWMSDFSNGLMVESGGNLVRWMHITPWKQDIESCDRVGLIQAMPAGDAEGDVQGRRWELRKEVMRDAIIYNRNNPSVVFYESGNAPISEAHMQEMKDIRDQWDPKGARAIGSRNMQASKVAEYGGEMLYTNKSEGKPMWAMEYSRDEGLRKYWDEFSPPFHKDGAGPLHNNQDASSYNRNQDSHALENVARWYEFWKERPGTGKRVSSGGVNIIFSDSNTHHRGEENYRRSGEVDPMRIPKDGFYAHQVMWDGWVEPERNGIHIVGHWNYKSGTKKDVYVISTGVKTELFVNGVSKGFGERSNGFAFTFKNIAWKAGTIKAVSYDAQNKKLAEAEIKTAGDPVGLKLTVQQDPKGLKADGADVALVQVEVVDAQGNRCPTALDMIDFKLDGKAEWRGGLAQGPDNYILAKSLPVECGVNRVIIRSTTEAGQILLNASAKGLKTATLQLKSVPVNVTEGLSLVMPDENLKPDLKRGPTPAKSSFLPSRISLAIASAIAGTNLEKVNASFDDNELTNWSNDGKLSTGWIEYRLAQEATVNEISLKLNGFRSTSYPLKIFVDGKEVFNGATPRSLGYCTLVCKPVRGKTVRIQLAGNSSVKADANAGVEVGGKKLEEGLGTINPNAKGVLNIIEAEIYGTIK